MEVILINVIDKLISPNQHAFLKASLLVDGVVVINKVVDLTKRTKKYLLIFKVDFEKRYMIQLAKSSWIICLSGLGSMKWYA